MYRYKTVVISYWAIYTYVISGEDEHRCFMEGVEAIQVSHGVTEEGNDQCTNNLYVTETREV